MLVRLCSVPAATEELARKDDLTLLFSALSSWCPQHNLLWRKNANEVLVVLTRHGLTTLVLGYVHSKILNYLGKSSLLNILNLILFSLAR